MIICQRCIIKVFILISFFVILFILLIYAFNLSKDSLYFVSIMMAEITTNNFLWCDVVAACVVEM